MATSFRIALIVFVVLGCSVAQSQEPRITNPHFLGSQSCMSTACHGGGKYAVIKRDMHSDAHLKLGIVKSQNYAATLGITDPTRSARCTVCHSTMQALPPDRLVKGALVRPGVDCENCHGPAENYLLSHTRRDYSHDQRIALGMRPAKDLYNRANVCIACHHLVDTDILNAGHPELYFEFDGLMQRQPPHWKDEGTWLGPRAWLTGQASALREFSWRLGKANDPGTAARMRGLAWLLRKTEAGASLPQTDDFAAMQAAADRLARAAARQNWTKDSTLALFKRLAASQEEFRDANVEAADQRRRGEALNTAMQRLWALLKTEGKLSSDNVDIALKALASEAAQKDGFQPARFAAALQSVEAALELMPKA